MDDKIKEWCEEVRQEAIASRIDEEHNFLEIKNLPKKIDGKSLTSLIVAASRIVPKTTDICIKQDTLGPLGLVALVEFKTQLEAFKAVEKLKLSSYGKSWHFKIMKDPNLADPLIDPIREWMR